MQSTFADQLAGLDLAGFTIGPPPVTSTDYPSTDAITQTLVGVWSDLFAMLVDTALEADAEDICWGLVNLFHRAAQRKSSAVALRWKPGTLSTAICYRRLYLDSAFPNRFVDEINQAEVLKWFARVSRTGGPGAGNRSMEILRAMFNKAEAWGYREECSNPCQGIRPNRRRKLECFLSNDELARLGEALEDLKRTHLPQATAILVLALTGCRRSEILHLTWDEVKGRRLLMHDSKTGPRTVWVGEEVRALLDALPKHAKHNRVFWSGDEDSLAGSVEHYFRKLRATVGLSHVRLHDLRHSFASHAAAMSETLPMIGQLLGHSTIGSTARYAHLDDCNVLLAVERIGELLERSFL